MKRCFWFVVFCLGLMGSVAAVPAPINQSPPAYPTEVYFDVVIIDIPHFNAREETYAIEGSLLLEWVDERLAFDEYEVGLDYMVYHEAEAQRQLATQIWSPMVEFENIRGKRTIVNSVLSISPDGTVNYEEHFVASLSTVLDLREFPFDTQALDIRVASFFYNEEELVWADESGVSFRPGFEMNEWLVVDEPRTKIVTRLPYGMPFDEVAEEQGIIPFSFGEFTLTMERQAGFYIWKLMVPIMIITSISWVGFWRKPSVAPRMNMTFSCMLTVVAYNFVVGNNLPHISYLTRLDKIFILTYVFIALAILESVVTAYLTSHGREEAAVQLDKRARLFFPVVYLTLYALLIFV